jgi:hypothetical protein
MNIFHVPTTCLITFVMQLTSRNYLHLIHVFKFHPYDRTSLNPVPNAQVLFQQCLVHVLVLRKNFFYFFIFMCFLFLLLFYIIKIKCFILFQVGFFFIIISFIFSYFLLFIWFLLFCNFFFF